jgi:hypothetical protein
MGGDYSILTDARGENTLIVDATVTSRNQLSKDSILGMGWGIGFNSNK